MDKNRPLSFTLFTSALYLGFEPRKKTAYVLFGKNDISKTVLLRNIIDFFKTFLGELLLLTSKPKLKKTFFFIYFYSLLNFVVILGNRAIVYRATRCEPSGKIGAKYSSCRFCRSVYFVSPRLTAVSSRVCLVV